MPYRYAQLLGAKPLKSAELEQNRRLQHKNTFVLKTYRSAEAEDNYKAERDAYMKLRWAGKPSPHIIAYYGGFIHGDSYNLILEYADQGTLETFMRNTESPLTVEDTLLFWDRLFDITHGVMTIHGKIGNNSSASQILNGYGLCPVRYVPLLMSWSTDGIKMLNQPTYWYLVETDHHHMTAISRSQIWDLLISYPASPNQMIPQTWTPLALERMVRLTYKTAFSDLTDECLGAPETFRSHVDTESSPLQVTQAVDIWSIGCVFSEGSVWAHHGWRRVVEYRRQRSVEIKAKGGDEGEHMFHVDGNLLDAVHNIHQDILGKSLTSGHITQSVLDRLVGEMLLRDESRPHAKWVFDKSKRLISEAETKYGISVTGLAGNSSSKLIDVKEAASKTRSPPQVPHEHYRSRAEGELPLGEPLPPDDDSSPSSSSSSSSSRSQSSPRRHHHKSASQGSKSRSIRAMESPPTGGQGSHVVPNLLTPPSTATNTQERSPPQHVQQRQGEPLRPTLSIDGGHAWKKKKKAGEFAVLPGEENLTSLDQRDHVSHVPSRPKLANKSL